MWGCNEVTWDERAITCLLGRCFNGFNGSRIIIKEGAKIDQVKFMGISNKQMGFLLFSCIYFSIQRGGKLNNCK